MSLVLMLSLSADAATGLLLGEDTVFLRVPVSENTPATAAVTLRSDTGTETVALTETEAWQHGTATLSALPTVDSAATLQLVDADGAPLASFSGTLTADGALALTADSADGPDIRILAATSWSAAAGVEVGLDLAGADVADVAYATLTLVESREIISCEKGGECTTIGETITTEVEVAWDDVGTIWEGTPSMTARGTVEAKATTYNPRGKKISTYKAEIGEAIADGGYGAGTLAVADGTSFALLSTRFSSWDTPMEVPRVVVSSDGWSRTGTLPASATFTQADGTTYTLTPNSVQAAALGLASVPNPDGHDTFRVSIGGGTLSVNGNALLAVDTLATPRCAAGWCLSAVDAGDGTLGFVLSAYATTAAALPTDTTLTVTLVDADGVDQGTTALYPHFQDDVVVMFVGAPSFDGDPDGRQLVGSLTLRGPSEGKKKGATLVKGDVYGTIGRDADGDLTLAGIDKGEAAPEDVMTDLSSLTVELADDDGSGTIDGPTVIVEAKDKLTKEEAAALQKGLVDAGATVEVK